MKYYACVLAFMAAFIFCTKAFGAWPDNAKIDHAASSIAGKPVVVECASTAQEWDQWVRTAYHDARTGANTAGYTYPGQSVVYLSNILCSTAHYALRVGWGKARAFYLGALIDVLSHESNHAYGVTNEADTEACAHRYYALTIHNLFGVQYHTANMRLMVSFATAYAKGLPPDYQGGVCTR